MIKRIFDVVLAAAGIVVLAPLMGALAVAVRLSSPGPALYRARRVGRGGVPFTMLKFRTMHVSSGGAAITRADDARVTRVGRALRAWKLDELPQLFNVIRGDMSFVGPRPEDPRYVALYDEVQRAVLAVRPGITGAASLAFRDEESRLTGEEWESTYVGTILPEKLRIELEYLRRASFFTDVRLILATLAAVARR